LDWYISKITNGTKHFDEDGNHGRKGKISEQLLQEMFTLPYFSRLPPKTTGRELFTFDLAIQWENKGKELGLSEYDILSTFTELTARSISNSYKTFLPKYSSLIDVVVGGGGCRNTFLMERIKINLENDFQIYIPIQTHEFLGINSESKEAMLFAVLAVMCFSGRSVSIPSCTGAKHKTILGKITPGENFNTLLTLDY